MPELTGDEAASGLSGLTVVFALLNEIIPAIQKNAPRSNTSADASRRVGSPRLTGGAMIESGHITNAKNMARAAGGILVSSVRIGLT